MILGFTGSQSGMTDWQKEKFRELIIQLKITELHHGDCIGADEEANNIAYQEGISIFSIHPPSNYNKRSFCFDPFERSKFNKVLTEFIDYDNIRVRWYPIKPYLERNKEIVDKADTMIAAPKEYGHTIKSGTWATIRYCWKIKRKIVIIPPVDRSLEEEEEGKISL